MGWGGSRKGAGRKAAKPAVSEPSPPAPEPAPIEHSDKSPEQVMDFAMRSLLTDGKSKDAAKVANDILKLRAAKVPAAGKKQSADELARAAMGGGRFAPRPAPKLN